MGQPAVPAAKGLGRRPRRRRLACLNIEPHDVLPTEPPGYYAALPNALKHYESIGNDDRERSYFVQMYLADVRPSTTSRAAPTGTAKRWSSWARAWAASKVCASRACIRK